MLPSYGYCFLSWCYMCVSLSRKVYEASCAGLLQCGNKESAAMSSLANIYNCVPGRHLVLSFALLWLSTACLHST